MKTLFQIFFLVVSTTTLYSSAAPMITASPNPATVGELVTFTVQLNNFCYETDADNDNSMVYPLGRSNGTVSNLTSMTTTAQNNLEQLNSPATYTYTYGAPGTFTVDFECANAFSPTPPFQGDNSVKVSTKRIGATTNMNLVVNPAPAAIPTMGEWGLIILGISLGILGLVSIYNRKKVLV